MNRRGSRAAIFMDATTLANQVMTALAPILPYLSSAVTAIASKAGEDVYQQGKKLYEAVRARFAKEPDDKASKALQAYVDDPDLASSVEIKLLRLIQNDPDFANMLHQILQAHAGPRQVIDLSDRARASENVMKNTQGKGFQGIRASGDAVAEKNTMTHE